MTLRLYTLHLLFMIGTPKKMFINNKEQDMGKASRLKKQRKILEGMGINVRRKAKERKNQQEQIKEPDKSDDEICSFIDTDSIEQIFNDEQVVLIKKIDIVLNQSSSRIKVLLIL